MTEFLDAVISSPLPGNLRIGICLGDRGLRAIEFLPSDTPLRRPGNSNVRSVTEQLQCYFREKAFVFDLPLELDGTDYQRRVWRALLHVGPGEVRTYGRLATELTSGPRAIASACRANPIPIIVPCHRIVASGGLGGYMGATGGEPLQIKQWLLHHEGVL